MTPTVSVVIPCYGHAIFLAEAIDSVLAQAGPEVEVVVVDDGSPDHTAEVAARYAGVRYVHQDNRGLAAARNTGLQASHGRYLVFLDADDRLLPGALAAGLACLAEHPDCAFVSGGFRRISVDGSALGDPDIPNIGGDHYVELLRRSYISMHATVMFRRETLELVHGFDTTLPVCEDFDIYLRIARSHPVRCHSAIVAEYRRHTSNQSSNSGLMLRTALRVLRSQWRYVKVNARHREAYREGMRFWKAYYGHELVERTRESLIQRQPRRAIEATVALLRLAPAYASRRLVKATARRSKRGAARTIRTVVPARLVGRSRALRWLRPEPLPLGTVGLGDLDRLAPISRQFGFDRGIPIDRYYIEAFLLRYAGDIAGTVLEIADNAYTMQFGGTRVTTSDILHVNAENPKATFVADLTDAPQVPSDRFDCVVLTQTLHLIYDMKAAVRTLHRILKPGGVLLLTSPGISQVDQGIPGCEWYWALTQHSLRRLLEEEFSAADVQIEDYGNVFAAVTFLHGLALAEVPPSALDHRDSAYPVIVAARAVKRQRS